MIVQKNRIVSWFIHFTCLEAWRRRDLASCFLRQNERLEPLKFHRGSEGKRRVGVHPGVAE
jgi:hypothetical protein